MTADMLIFEATKAFNAAGYPLDLDEAWRTIVAPHYEQLATSDQELVSKAYYMRLSDLER